MSPPSFPVEIITHILSNLSIQDLMTCALASKHFRALSQPLLFKRLPVNVELSKVDVMSGFLQYLRQIEERIQTKKIALDCAVGMGLLEDALKGFGSSLTNEVEVFSTLFDIDGLVVGENLTPKLTTCIPNLDVLCLKPLPSNLQIHITQRLGGSLVSLSLFASFSGPEWNTRIPLPSLRQLELVSPGFWGHGWRIADEATRNMVVVAERCLVLAGLQTLIIIGRVRDQYAAIHRLVDQHHSTLQVLKVFEWLTFGVRMPYQDFPTCPSLTTLHVELPEVCHILKNGSRRFPALVNLVIAGSWENLREEYWNSVGWSALKYTLADLMGIGTLSGFMCGYRIPPKVAGEYQEGFMECMEWAQPVGEPLPLLPMGEIECSLPKVKQWTGERLEWNSTVSSTVAIHL
ncbi:hypothetical protein VNI00_016085 [Paramarasmius palmivorus]|uniref:F-box domain-containing protein n=1 Tax=Paramarasmius palmivorus TaxID=297713 RepID=A0AAW0BHQ9_9AGAR